MNFHAKTTLALLCSSGIVALGETPTNATNESRLEFRQGENLIAAWQKDLLKNPAIGEKFAASAFVHPLCTPSGFECTMIQAKDHPHHLGVWWPWKFVEVDGKKFNTWEVQMGEGAHVGKTAKTISSSAEKTEWEIHNETLIKPKNGEPKSVIHETGRIILTMRKDATVMDISLKQKVTGSPVTIAPHRYSGFSWRGTTTWNKDNSTMTTSGGMGRDNANGTPARWIVVSGPTPKGKASLLILSLAEKIAGTPEKLRVWDSTMEHGCPFVNFNPVLEKPLPLDDAHPAVSHRKYRVIAADRVIDAASAEAEWQKWASE